MFLQRSFSPIMQLERQYIVERSSESGAAIQPGENGSPVTTESGRLVGMAIARGQYPPEGPIGSLRRVDLGRYAIVTPLSNILSMLQWFNHKLL